MLPLKCEHHDILGWITLKTNDSISKFIWNQTWQINAQTILCDDAVVNCTKSSRKFALEQLIPSVNNWDSNLDKEVNYCQAIDS
jgi:hypothetical protein